MNNFKLTNWGNIQNESYDLYSEMENMELLPEEEEQIAIFATEDSDESTVTPDRYDRLDSWINSDQKMVADYKLNSEEDNPLLNSGLKLITYN